MKHCNYFFFGAMAASLLIGSILYFFPRKNYKKIIVISFGFLVFAVCASLLVSIVSHLRQSELVDIKPKQIIKIESVDIDDVFRMAAHTVLYSEFGPKIGLLQSQENYSMEEIQKWIPALKNVAKGDSILWIYHATPLAFSQANGVLYVKTKPASGIFFIILNSSTSIKSIKPR